MNTKYIDLIYQTFDFPQSEFAVKEGNLFFHDIDLNRLIQEYGSPLKFTYLPQISNNISKVKNWFRHAFLRHEYRGSYTYCYCTKSSHFRHVLEEALKSGAHIETSSAFDLSIVENLKRNKRLSDSTYILCNGFKQEQYISNIANLVNGGHHNCIPIVDNFKEEMIY